MAKFYGTKLSDNMKRTPEGYLICFNAVIGRTGYQVYKGSELPEDELKEQGIVVDADADVKVLRVPDEVFKASALSSFEGKPFTNTHPDELVDVDTIQDVQCGHVQNVRKGTEPLENGDWPLLADIVVTDKETIHAIEVLGIRELSCGYNYHILKDGNNILQIAIIGNHVALVQNGRAGQHAKIQDSQPRINMSKVTNSFLRALGLHSLAKTATPEEFAVAFDAATKDSEEKPAVDNKHGEGCECKSCKPAGKDAKHGEGCECKTCKPGAKDKHEGMDGDEKQLAGLLAGGAGAIKSKKTEGLDGDPEEEGRQAGELEVLSEEEEEEGEEEEGRGEDEEFEEGGEGGEGEDGEPVESEAAPVIPKGDRSKNIVPSATDAAYRKGRLDVLKVLKPMVAKSGNKRLVAAMDSAMKQLTSRPTSKGSYGSFNAGAKRLGPAAKDSLAQANAAQKKIEDINAEYRKMRGVNSTKK